jgi:hypothetical protein
MKRVIIFALTVPVFLVLLVAWLFEGMPKQKERG